jgi:hypothetical protein
MELLKDFLQASIKDSGTFQDMRYKYEDKLFVFVTDDPLSDKIGYVVEIGDAKDEEKMTQMEIDYCDKLRKNGYDSCTSSLVIGVNIASDRMHGFIGGIGVNK